MKFVLKIILFLRLIVSIQRGDWDELQKVHTHSYPPNILDQQVILKYRQKMDMNYKVKNSYKDQIQNEKCLGDKGQHILSKYYQNKNKEWKCECYFISKFSDCQSLYSYYFRNRHMEVELELMDFKIKYILFDGFIKMSQFKDQEECSNTCQIIKVKSNSKQEQDLFLLQDFSHQSQKLKKIQNIF